MSRKATVYVCQQCGAHSPKWVGRCPECGEWNCMVEEIVESAPARGKATTPTVKPEPLARLKPAAEMRTATGFEELDRVLGGGLVPGSTVLVGGDPGIGKSTLLLQVCELLSRAGKKSLYITAEESPAQIKMRAERLGVGGENVFLLSETDFSYIPSQIEEARPEVAVVDSIQMVYQPELGSAPGSVSQVRQCGAELVRLAKQTGTTIFLIGHVTKEGTIAGPRVLEHIVDTVLYFEGDRFHSYRVLRAVKNRFGATNEIGIFEMRDTGLVPVPDASKMFLSHSSESAGSVIVSCIEGSRAFLVEVQALVSRAVYGMPERKVSGADYNRVCMLLAVLEKRAGLKLHGQDIFVNVVGGMRVVEPAADAGIALAIASSLLERPLPARTFVMGEVGLTGEMRPVSRTEARLKEGLKLGFESALLPAGSHYPRSLRNSLRIVEARTINGALELLSQPPEA